jgi:uncharacterized protein
MNAIAVDSVLRPVATDNRIVTLDVLRGVAVLGILLLTISKFAMPGRYMEEIVKSPGTLDFNIAFFVTVLMEGKMRATFSMIFGAGVLLFVRDKEKSEMSSARVFYRRTAWLAVFGLLHTHLLLWGGDILYFYSLCGFALYLFRNAKPTFLIAAMVAACMFEMALFTYFHNHSREQRLAYLQVQKIEDQGLSLTEEQLNIKNEWLEKEKGYYPDPAKIKESIEIKRSDYLTMAKDVRPGMVLRQTKQVPILVLDPIQLMFLGMALFHWGFLSGRFSKKFYALTLIACYGIGIPLEVYSWKRALEISDQIKFLETHAVNVGIYIFSLKRILVALGHVSLVMLMIKSGWLKNIFSILASVGKMAFSNYILQSLICCFLFFGYGFGYYAMLEYHELFVVVLVIWILQLTISPIWLSYFRFGPLEWVWRSLTYWKLQPMRIRQPEVEVSSPAR